MKFDISPPRLYAYVILSRDEKVRQAASVVVYIRDSHRGRARAGVVQKQAHYLAKSDDRHTRLRSELSGIERERAFSNRYASCDVRCRSRSAKGQLSTDRNQCVDQKYCADAPVYLGLPEKSFGAVANVDPPYWYHQPNDHGGWHHP